MVLRMMESERMKEK